MRTIISVATVVALLFSLATAGSLAQAPDFSKTANPELVGSLAKELGSTPQQAEGAAGALFGVAQSRLSPGDWGKVSQAVPGMDGLLKAAPAMGAAGGAAGMLGKAGGLANATAAFQKLGLKPEMVAKAVPIVTQYASKAGGAGIGSLLTGVLK
jgi:hypothetical protein